MNKTEFYLCQLPIRRFKKLLMIMKLTTFLILACTLQITANVYAQTKRFDLSLSDITIKEVLKNIESQSDFRFFYNDELSEVNRLVSIDKKGMLINEVLTYLFEGTGVTFKVLENNLIVISPENLINSQQQVKRITGTVTDQKGVPIPGVTVVLKGTTTGIVTSSDGKYQLSVPADAKTLMFSFVGMKSQEFVIGNNTTINVTMAEETISLEEVVAVGYGVQKKANLSGSVSTIKTEELAAVTMPTVSQAIMGRAPGVFIKNVNGQPGDESAIGINIRGFGEPLIIIDGVPATNNEFQQLATDDIESFSVLKDAAAASVYGARAGNGVILVTTKRGAVSDTKITFSSVMQWQHFTVIPHFVNSEQYARMENLSRLNEALPPLWTDEQIQKFADGSDPNNYPNVDWWDKSIRPFAPQSENHINVQGGNQKVKYFVSGGYFYQEAMPRANETKNKRYNLRSNIDIALTSKMKLNLDLSALYQDYYGPTVEMERTSSSSGIMGNMFRSRPYYPFAFPDPTKIPGNRQDPYYISFIENVGYKKWNRLNGDAKVGFSYDLPFGFQVKANFHVNKENYNNKVKDAKTPTYNYDWNTGIYTDAGFLESGNQNIYNYVGNSNRFDQQYFLTWDKKFVNHNVKAMVVYELLSNDNYWFEASRTRYDFDIDYLFAGPDLDKDNNGSASEGGRKGIISRLNYDYKGKYLVELNARNDASAKFPKETRWGFFPSASVAWRISEEAFIKNNLPIISNLKLRASYGKLGYDNTGNFQYLDTYSITSPFILNGSTNILSKGIKADAIPNTSITWEKMTTKNIGLDFSLWHNLLEGSFDYFYRLRSDVLGARNKTIPNVVGATMPQVNYAKYDNRGWEFSLNHSNKIGDINYSVGGNISWNREKAVFVDQAAFTNDEARRRGNQIGEWTDNFWAVMSDGFFQTKEEINNWADQDGKNNTTILPGDLKYIDYNGDGKITADDRVITGRGSFPKLMYGINMSLAWKGIDFSMLWQGAGDYDFNLLSARDYVLVWAGGNTPTTQMLKDSYVPENPWLPTKTTDVSFPLYRTLGTNKSHPSFTTTSDFWLINGAYVRLKNIELGYTLPANITRKVGIDKCKFYVAAYNLLTFSAVDFIDPEADTNASVDNGDYYPPVGTYSIGFVLQF